MNDAPESLDRYFGPRGWIDLRSTPEQKDLAPAERLVAGRWARASDYEIRDGCIVPVWGAAIEHYDPWVGYYSLREEERARAGHPGRGRGKKVDLTPGPYAGLVGLLTKDKEGDGPRCDNEEAVLDWYRRNGPLGLLMCQSSQATLHPSWALSDERDHESEEPEEVLVPAQTRHVRTPQGWRSFVSYARRYSEPLDQAETGQPVLEEACMYWPSPSATWQKFGSPDMRTVPLNDSWAAFFPSVPASQANTYQYPRPGTSDFWRSYGEPLGAFLAAAKRFWQMMEDMADDDVSDRSRGLRTLTSLVSPLSPGGEITKDGEIRQRWFSPALISAFGMMLLQDQAEPARLRVCPRCGRPHVARYKLYCSKSCQLGKRQDRYKERVEQARRLHHEGVKYPEIAKTLGSSESTVRKWILDGLK